MSVAEEMPDNPGDPEETDPEELSPDEAEAAVDEAEAAREATGAERDAEEPDGTQGLSPEAERDIADLEAELADAGVAGAGDAADDGGLSLELAERTEDLKRVTAEYANYRRRGERERAAAVAAAKAGMAAELLPILDDLSLAEQHGDLESGPLRAFAEKLRGTVASLGVAGFGEEGEPFDPEIHEAVQDTSSGEEKVLGTVLRRGYRMEGRVVRTAMVVISDPA